MVDPTPTARPRGPGLSTVLAALFGVVQMTSPTDVVAALGRSQICSESMSINYMRCHRADIEVELAVLVRTSRGKGNVMKKALTIILLIAFAAPILGSSAYAGPRGGW